MQSLKLTPLPNSIRHRRQSVRHQHGMTLVEWMVSMTIGLILVAALAALIARQSSTQAELEKSSRQIENGRYAMQLLNEDIQMAGYYGEFSNVASLTLPLAPPDTPDSCSKAVADLTALMAWPVQGYDAPATGLSTCVATANHVPGTDILVVRHADNATITSGLTAGQVYLQSGLTGLKNELKFVMGTAASPTVDTTLFNLIKKDGTVAPLRKFLVHIYFVSPCSVMANATACASTDDGGKPIPTLKMLELSAAGGITAMSTIALVEGIENMQIDYGIDTTGDGAPDGQFVAMPAIVAGVADWANLVALRVHLLVRSNELSAGYVDSKSYVMGYDSAGAVQTVTPTTDSYGNNVRPYKRHLFSQMIRLVNPSSRRDQ